MRVGDTRFSLGNRIEVLETARSSGGQRFTVRAFYAPRRRFPPLHLHPQQTETFSLRAGELTVRWLDGERTYAAGESFQVPPGTPHAMRGAGSGVAVVDWTVEPALRSEELFGRLFSARPRPPLADVLAFIWHVLVSWHFRSEIVLVRRERATLQPPTAASLRPAPHPDASPPGSPPQVLTRMVLVLLGLSHLAVAVLFFFAPAWAYAHMAHFPPYNPHFIADIGAFNLPLGAGLLLAARAPRQQRVLIGLAALGDLAHALSHLRDHALHGPPSMTLLAGGLTQSFTLLSGLLLLALTLGLAPRQD